MFDFQKEVILNSLDSVEKFDNGFRVDGMLYKNEYVGPVYKTEAVEGAAATITIKVSDVNAGMQQIVIELGLDNDYRGEFGSALYYFRKPILIDAREAMTADSLKTALKKVCASNSNVLKFTNPDAEDAFVLKAVDNFITVRRAEVVTFACGSASCSDAVMEEVDSVDPLTVTENNVGFGTYDYMIHNLRLPTYANIRFASPAESEMPVKGGKYTQYSFEYTVPRRLGGLSVAGQKTESTTIHTFFVLNSGTNVANFEALLPTGKLKSVTKNENGKVSFDHTPKTDMHENLANGIVSKPIEDGE